MKLEHFLTPYTKVNSKWINDLNIRLDTIKLRGKHGTFFDIYQSNVSFDSSPTVMDIKTNKWDLVKLKSFCTVKLTINKMKRQSTEWEEIFANDVTNKGLVSKIYKQLL